MKRFIAFLLVALLVLCGCATEAPAGSGFTKFNTVDLEGTRADESLFQGKKVTMINIWATYCGPCISEMPGLGVLAEKYADSEFQIVGLITDVQGTDTETAESARAIIKKTKAGYRNLLVSKDLIPTLQTVSAVPTTIFVDEKGKQIGAPYVGARPMDVWEEIIAEVLEQVQ